MVNTLPQQTTTEPDDWIPQPPTDLIFDGRVPLETNQHCVAMNVLKLLSALPRRTDRLLCRRQYVFYYSSAQAKNQDFRGPDFFVILDVEGTRSRQGWVVWEEEGRYPDVIVELMSPSTAKVDLGLKKELYDRVFKTKITLYTIPLMRN